MPPHPALPRRGTPKRAGDHHLQEAEAHLSLDWGRPLLRVFFWGILAGMDFYFGLRFVLFRVSLRVNAVNVNPGVFLGVNVNPG